MAQQTNGNGKYLPWVAAAIGTIGLLGSGLTFFVQIGQLETRVSMLEASLKESSYRTSRTDGAISNLQLQAQSHDSSLKEIETQFCASDIVRNLMHANELREISLLWQKSFGVPYPIDNSYYPTICNRPTEKQ